MAMPTTSFALPHPKLTAIVGTPTNTTITKLIQEVFANARTVPSTRGGSGHGHLGMIMTAQAYQMLAGTAFQLLIHPGNTLNIPTTQTEYEITEGIRLYKATIAKLTLATSLREEIKKQILAAVERMYFEILEDATFGFADVSVIDLLTHLTNTYSKITRADLETNVGVSWCWCCCVMMLVVVASTCFHPCYHYCVPSTQWCTVFQLCFGTHTHELSIFLAHCVAQFRRSSLAPCLGNPSHVALGDIAVWLGIGSLQRKLSTML